MIIEEKYIESIYSYCQGVESQLYNLNGYKNELILDESSETENRKHLSSNANDNVSRHLKFNLGSILNAHASVLDYFYNLLLKTVGFTHDDINGQTFSLMYDKEVMSFFEQLGREGKKSKAFEELKLNDLNIKIGKYREENSDHQKGMPYDIVLMREIFAAFFKHKNYKILSKRKKVINEICDVLFGYTQELHPAMVHQSYTPAILKELNNLVKHNFLPDIICPNPYKGAFISLTLDCIPYLNDGLLKKILELDLKIFKESESLMGRNPGIAFKDIPLFKETNIFGFEFINLTNRINVSEFMIDKIFIVKAENGIIISYGHIMDEVLKTIGKIKESINSLPNDSRIDFIKLYHPE
ncbi:TPA: hypothetical protein JDE59_001967 [Salmonella enterica subsp. diarizonae]|nr:hypothetical protein [Salmonella enterica subsp. diarizonae]